MANTCAICPIALYVGQVYSEDQKLKLPNMVSAICLRDTLGTILVITI